MAKIVLIVGTDTGVGKTRVATGLGYGLARRGIRVVAIKPVESGASEFSREEEDGVQLARATGQSTPAEALCRLRAPLAPPVAADLERVVLDPQSWVDRIRAEAKGAEVVLVEGAGGLLSPLAWGYDARDLCLDLEASALLVAADRLGTLNHTLLTLEALESREIPVLGIVLSAPPAPDDSTGRNREGLMRAGGRREVIMLPRVATIEEAALGLEEAIGWLLG